jgi:MoxR-like ATPase
MMRVKVGRPLIELLKLCYQANRPPLLVGPAGAGKSEILKAAADELKVGFLSRDLSLMEPTDLVGLPRLQGGVTRYFPPAFLPTRGRGLLIFEELNRCPAYMRAPCLQLLTARCLNDYSLPRGWLPAAAINPAGEDYDVDDLDPALRSRFVQVEVEPDVEEWLAWARAHGVHPAVTDYVSADPSALSGPGGSPRAWAYVSDVVQAQERARPGRDSMLAAVAGLVGEKRAAAFLRFLDDRVRPLTADEVLSSYPSHRPQLRQWARAGQLDLVRGTLLAVQKSLQCRHNYDAVKARRAARANLAAFLSDLPGDLREQAEAFFGERGYSLSPAGRR